MAQEMLTLAKKIAKELQIIPVQVEKTIELLDEGATVPFIARYRKEVTGGLDDRQLRLLQERLYYLRELDERRQTIIHTIREQEKLTPELEQQILAADTKNRLEDLYLPYRPKRRTKAHLAREAGLAPLADKIFHQSDCDPLEEAHNFLNPDAGIPDVQSALEGARQIVMEWFAEDAQLLDQLRKMLWQQGQVKSVAHKDVKDQHNKFKDYFDYQEAIQKIPSHRALALFRGRRESALQLQLILPEQLDCEAIIRQHFSIPEGNSAREQWLQEAVRMAWKVKLLSKLELELMARLRESADEEAVRVFAKNLRDLLLAAPAGPRVTIGLDPGIRTGVKVVVVDHTGKLLDYTTLFPLPPQNEWHQSIAELAKFAIKYNATLISIGNGTGSRETERLVTEMLKTYADINLEKIVVSEAGASVYSASELASNEFPDLDVTLRGAVSIARRIQDPLAELVKIDPKAIGVGQYQHDVNQVLLARGLEAVVEDCVNAVGVDVNMASAPLLARISGLNESLANNIVQYRNEHGAFNTREELLKVPRMGEKTYQQAAGFLRINTGTNPLDASAVHPEAYPLVERIMKEKSWTIKEVIGDTNALKAVNAADFIDEHFGLPTIHDVLKELEKPGRDPRPEFRTVQFKEGVEAIQHLQTGMILEGVISNVTNFGAFVDIGVHQDGLVHISEMTTRFINDPHQLVKAGDIVKVRVMDVDQKRRRISLSMKLEEKKPAQQAPKHTTDKNRKTSGKPKDKMVNNRPKAKPKAEKPIFNTVMADALAKLKREM